MSYAGIVSLIIASISWAFGSMYLHRSSIARRIKKGNTNAKISTNSPWYNQLLLMAMQMLIGGLLLIIVGIALGEYSSLNILKISSQSLIGLIYMIAIGAIAGFTIFVWLLKNTSAFLANTFTYISPVIVIFLGWVIGEVIVIARIIPATAMILGSVALIVISGRSITITTSAGDADSTSINSNSLNKDN
ncbi:MAG: EamA family transporter [Clostridia bacterium]